MMGQIIDILTQGRFARAIPYGLADIEKIVRLSIDANSPIPLVAFWGIGFKDKVNHADVKTCEFLSEYNRRVQELYPPGIDFHFIFATKHGEHNGVSNEIASQYVESMKGLFAEHSFNYSCLDGLWEKYGISSEQIELLAKEIPDSLWKSISGSAVIERNAAARNKVHAPLVAAKKYYAMRNLEKKALETEYGGSIFHAFTSPELRSVLPDMPILYLYSRKGWSNCPWFVYE